MTLAAELLVKIGADTSDFEGKMEGVASRFQSIGDRIGNIGRGMTTAVTLPLAAIGALSINAASDMNESMNKVSVVFDDAGQSVIDFTSTAADQLGMSQQAALEAAGTFGNLFTSMGMATGPAAEMSTDLLTLSADLASFNNLDPTQVFEKLRSGLVGEVEPLRALGINLTQATVEAKAMEMGLAATADALTPAMMIQARYALITEQSANAQGDFARTADGFANKTRIVKAQVKDLAAGIGQQLLPFALKLLEWVQKGMTWFGQLSPTIKTVILVVAGLAAALGPVLMVLGPIISGIGAVIPIITAVVGVIGGPLLLVIGAVIAVVTLLALAWKNNWGGIQEKTAAVWEWLKNAFSVVVEWLRDVIPPAIQKLADFWNNTLLPAINAVWEFINTYLVPLFTALWELLSESLKLAIEVLAGIWTNVLLPAITKIYDYIKTKLQPIFEKIVTFWNTTLKPAIESLVSDQLDKLAKAWKAIKDAIQFVIDKVQAFITKLKNIKLPDWLQVHSPTPFEMGLWGIANALDYVNAGLDQMDNALGGLQGATIGVGESARIGNGRVGAMNTGQSNVIVYGGMNLYEQQNGRSILAELNGLASRSTARP